MLHSHMLQGPEINQINICVGIKEIQNTVEFRYLQNLGFSNKKEELQPGIEKNSKNLRSLDVHELHITIINHHRLCSTYIP